jgi:hypothetical protein
MVIEVGLLYQGESTDVTIHDMLLGFFSQLLSLFGQYSGNIYYKDTF